MFCLPKTAWPPTSAIYGSNNQVCPLTPLAEELGAASGSITDIYLPGWLSRRIPVISSLALVVGMILNVDALRRRQNGEVFATRWTPAAAPTRAHARARLVRAARRRDDDSPHRAGGPAR